MKTTSIAILAALLMLTAPSVGATHDDLPKDQDNGREGRNSFNDPGHVAPGKACRDKLTATSKSLVLRVLPRGPLAPDGSLAFTSGVCVYLPPNYVRSGMRYPVLYLLHGGGSDHGAWMSLGGIRKMMDELIKADPRNALIVVSPDGNDAQWYDSYDRTILNERYMLDYVMPYIERHYRTIADRRGRSIAGLSNGGYGALHYAAKAPDRFVAAGSMSGNVGGRSFGGLGTPLFEGGPAFQEAGTYYYGNVPIELASNLDGLDLVVNWGASCATDAAIDLCATWGFEQAFRLDNQALRDRLIAVGHRGDLRYSEDEGGHSWRWWPKWLREKHLPVFLARMDDPVHMSRAVKPSPPRFPFRYRSIAPSFEVYGYHVSVDRQTSEFLDMLNVGPSGLTLQGSGRVTVVTPRLYKAGRRYTINGTGGPPQIVTADRGGRLTIRVDLGPSHETEQYQPQGRAMAASDDYWTVREVTIK